MLEYLIGKVCLRYLWYHCSLVVNVVDVVNIEREPEDGIKIMG
jgi:hypothetical protein